jgi:Tol biopolymer transport system component
MNAKRTLAGLVGLWALAIGCNNDVSGPRTGAARVTIATAGADLAPHGYMVSADSGAPLAVPVNGSATILGLKTGSHSVALGGLGNCAVNGANPRSVDVVAGRTTDVSFAITCATPAVTGKIAFTSDRDGTEQIYVMNADGSSPTRLTNGPANNRRPAWSPDGKRIVFASNRDGDFEIYVMDADGSNPTRLTNNPATDDQPAWSPDGTKIAFTSGRDGNTDIYVMNVDGSSPTRLTKYGPPWEVGLAAWSPDGTRIAYFEEICDPAPDGCGGSTQIMNADGSDDHGVVAGGSRPAWSPDGGRIAFGTGQIWVLYLDGSGHTEVIDPRDIGGQHIEPAWSPEGAKIVFASTGCYACSNSTLDIYVMNADGSGVVRLTHTGSDHSPAWRP